MRIRPSVELAAAGAAAEGGWERHTWQVRPLAGGERTAVRRVMERGRRCDIVGGGGGVVLGE